MKDASSTDVIVHRGTALTSFYQCGICTASTRHRRTVGKEDFNGASRSNGASRRTEGRRRHRRVAVLHLQQAAPYMRYGVVDANNDLVHITDIPLPGPRLPHDMAFTAELRHPQRLSAVLGS